MGCFGRISVVLNKFCSNKYDFILFCIVVSSIYEFQSGVVCYYAKTDLSSIGLKPLAGSFLPFYLSDSV